VSVGVVGVYVCMCVCVGVGMCVGGMCECVGGYDSVRVCVLV